MSDLVLKPSIGVGARIIDCDDMEEIGVILSNHSSEEFKVRHGDRTP